MNRSRAGWWLAAGLLASGGAAAQDVPAARPKANIICWEETRKLTWADFQAPKQPLVPVSGESYIIFEGRYMAVTESFVTVYDIRVDKDNTRTLVSAEFIKDRSWVTKAHSFDNKLV